jgi:hypothetical protein
VALGKLKGIIEGAKSRNWLEIIFNITLGNYIIKEKK